MSRALLPAFSPLHRAVVLAQSYLLPTALTDSSGPPLVPALSTSLLSFFFPLG